MIRREADALTGGSSAFRDQRASPPMQFFAWHAEGKLLRKAAKAFPLVATYAAALLVLRQPEAVLSALHLGGNPLLASIIQVPPGRCSPCMQQQMRRWSGGPIARNPRRAWV